MNDDRILAIQVKHADLQRCAIAGGADEHGQVIIHVDLSDGGADSVPDVGIAHPVLAGRRTDPHLGTLSFREYRVNNCCLLIGSRFALDTPAGFEDLPTDGIPSFPGVLHGTPSSSVVTVTPRSASWS